SPANLNRPGRNPAKNLMRKEKYVFESYQSLYSGDRCSTSACGSGPTHRWRESSRFHAVNRGRQEHAAVTGDVEGYRGVGCAPGISRLPVPILQPPGPGFHSEVAG